MISPLIDNLVYIKEINDKNGNTKHLLIHKMGLKLGTIEELIALANRKIPNDIKDEDQVFYKIILAHIMERIFFNKYNLLSSSLFILSINSEPAGIPFNKYIKKSHAIFNSFFSISLAI